MRVLLQRVSEASVQIEAKIHGQIGIGLLVLVGICEDDTKADCEWLVSKLLQMRIFSDPEGKMNLSVLDVGGGILLVSQFTLFADTKKGNRPSFIRAAKPEKAIPLYNYFEATLSAQLGKPAATGIFGADMKVFLVNDGPVTIWLDSHNRE
jgi:D-tyrosyl-tRNA(Tyr) deacylase